jgi:peptidoglycan/LPS O-acetylase OafA/YrhL
MAKTKHRFLVLDGMRGVAALVVVYGHAAERFDLPHAGHFGLAVDFFFMLSGFVIAHAYETELRAGLGFGNFALARIIRLYPLITLGGIIATAAYAATSLIALDHRSFGAREAISGLTTSLLIPFPLSLGGPAAAFAFNPPAWSLPPELAANALYAMTIFVFSPRALCAVVVTALIALLGVGLLRHGLGFGNYWADFPLGAVRVAFPFFLGVGLLRLRQDGRLGWARAPGWLCGAVLLLILCAPRLQDRLSYDAIAVTIIFPLLIACASNAWPSKLTASTWNIAGTLSYPIYILHSGLIRILGGIAGKLHLSGLKLMAWMGFEITVVCLCAYAATTLYDKPVRTKLSRYLVFSARPKRPIEQI